MLLPPLPEQHEIVRRVEALFKKADEIEARYKKAKAFVDKLTPSILAKAFRGELVPQDPNDEPASVLLERIRKQRVISTIKKKRGKEKNWNNSLSKIRLRKSCMLWTFTTENTSVKPWIRLLRSGKRLPLF